MLVSQECFRHLIYNIETLSKFFLQQKEIYSFSAINCFLIKNVLRFSQLEHINQTCQCLGLARRHCSNSGLYFLKVRTTETHMLRIFKTSITGIQMDGFSTPLRLYSFSSFRCRPPLEQSKFALSRLCTGLRIDNLEVPQGPALKSKLAAKA